mgnify:CR=1 FL=1
MLTANAVPCLPKGQRFLWSRFSSIGKGPEVAVTATAGLLPHEGCTLLCLTKGDSCGLALTAPGKARPFFVPSTLCLPHCVVVWPGQVVVVVRSLGTAALLGCSHLLLVVRPWLFVFPPPSCFSTCRRALGPGK